MPSPSPTKFVRPVVVVSKCLMGAHCRWDADTIRDPFVRTLSKYARLVPICPEIEIGLGTPRPKIILVSYGNRVRLYQPSSGRQLTRKMNSFTHDFLSSLKRVDGFILKHKSPSCGLRRVKRYESITGDASFKRDGTGLFATQIKRQFKQFPIEDEKRLSQQGVREHWLTHLFTLAAFHEAIGRRSPLRLAGFHGRHQLLLEAHGKRLAHRLGHLAEAGEVGAYQGLLYQLLSRSPQRTSLVPLFELALDYYRPHLKQSEVDRFRQLIQTYLDGTTELIELRKQVQIWAVRYDKDFIRRDAVYRPYPGPLA